MAEVKKVEVVMDFTGSLQVKGVIYEFNRSKGFEVPNAVAKFFEVENERRKTVRENLKARKAEARSQE